MSLTVKWVVIDGGLEKTRMFPANDVTVIYVLTSDGKPPRDKDGKLLTHFGYEISGPALFIDVAGNLEGRMLAEGKCYVMNSEARTIGSYNLETDFEKQKLYG